MAEQDAELSHDLEPRGFSSPLTGLDRRIADPRTSVEEAINLTRIRQEIVRQNEYQLDKSYARIADKRQFTGKMYFSGVALVAGLGLVVYGLTFVGLFMMGGGLYWLAPDYVRDWMSHFFRGTSDDAD